MDRAYMTFGGPRYSLHDIEACHRMVRPGLAELIAREAAPAVLLNEYWQVVLSNDAFLCLARAADQAAILGRRLGEILGCPNAGLSLSGCGTSAACPECGLCQAFYASQSDGVPRPLQGSAVAVLPKGASCLSQGVQHQGYSLRLCSFPTSSS